MKFRSLLLAVWCALFLGVGFTSCSDNDDDDEVTTGVFILNEGKMNGNNAGISVYNPKTHAVTPDIYLAQNDEALGDVGQDMIEYDDYVYVTVYNSSRLVKLDKEGRKVKSLSFSTEDGQPRNVVAEDGKLYVTLYSGQVARIDTADLRIEKYVQVGKNPEQIVEEDNKLYVANSGWGKDNTVSVIDLRTFEVIKTVEVVVNPNYLVEAEGFVYVISYGNYGDIPYTLSKINTKTYEVETITTATKMAEHNDVIYLANSVTDWSTYETTTTFFTYDARKHKLNPNSFLQDSPQARELATKSVYMIEIDPNNGDIYIGISDYTRNGDVYRFSKKGAFIKEFSTGSLNPNNMVFFD